MLPTLYKQTKTGAVQQYQVRTEGSQIIVTQGQVGGAQQSYYTTCIATNLGKANETTPYQQAILEAKSKWNKKIKQGYTEDPSGIVSVRLPMRVSVYQDHKSKVRFPALVTPKLNGCNALYRLEGDKLTLYSRGGEVYPRIPHLEEHIRLMMASLKCQELAGELYIHGQHLQDIQSAVKKPNALSKHLEFHIFEIPDLLRTRHEKARILHELNIHPSRPVKTVASHIAMSHEEIEELKAFYHNYEGLVIWNLDYMYRYNERSLDVFKYKDALDEEFKVVDYNVDKSGHPVLVCAFERGTFKVKPKGTDAQRKDILKNITDYIGKWYTVEFEMKSKEGKPLKPVGIGLRQCDAEGSPQE